MTARIRDEQVKAEAGPLPHGFDTHVFEVEPGTEIEHDGKILIVTDNAIVWLKNRVYCTARVYTQIIALTKSRLS